VTFKPRVNPRGVSIAVGANPDDDFDVLVKARIRATGETKAQARLWVHCNVVEPQHAPVRDADTGSRITRTPARAT
jgi:hypothetical protein